MIEVTYKLGDPQLAYNVMDKLAGLYMEKHLTVHRPTGSYDFFARETEKYKQALAESEVRLASFGKTEGVVAPDVERMDLAQVAMNSVAAFHQAEQAVAADERRIREEEAKMEQTPSRSPTQSISNSASLLLQQLEGNLLAARVKRTQLALKYDPSYPLVQEADQEIQETQAAITAAEKNQYVDQTTDRDPTYELLREDIAKTQADLSSQKATATALKVSIRGIQDEMVSLDQKAVKQADLLREVKADEANYLLYLSKREQERTSDALDQKRIGNVAIAVPPIMPILPAYSPALVLTIGCFLAVCLSVGSTFVTDYLDSSFRTPAEVFAVLRIPVLAYLPKQSVLSKT
jgi:polysaccharide biosynthesis transport protein